MKHLLLALVLFLATTVHAQTASPVKYCLLYTLNDSFHGTRLRLDYGQNMSLDEPPVQDGALAALATKIKRFDSVPAALSHLDSQGWEVVQTITLSAGTSVGQTGFLLRRRP
jgi:hypothetical protein